MTMVSWDDSIRDFIRQAASSSPTPGGGSVAAIVAALGAAMTSMVGRLSQGDKFDPIRQQVADVLEHMSALSSEFERLLHDDIVCFDRYMDALKLPKETDEEKHARKSALHEAAIHAIEVPIRLMEACNRGLDYAAGIAEESNKNVLSDLGIGALLFDAAAQSALLTVEINLASLKDESLKRQYEDKTAAVMNEIQRKKKRALHIARRRINE